MAELKLLLNVSGTRWGFPHGKITHETSLSGGQLHFSQRLSDYLIGAGMEHPNQMPVMMSRQNVHLLKVLLATHQCRLLHNSIFPPGMQ